MVSHINDYEFFAVNTEDDALFLEASLINKHKPHYNILLKDDKRFPYILIRTKDKKITIDRGTAAEPNTLRFGPYFNGIRAGLLLDIIRTVYNNDADLAVKFLQGKLTKETRDILQKKMQKAGEMQQYELAIAYRDGIRSLDKLSRRIAATPEDANAFTLGACRELGELLGLSKTPRRIECYDISHTGGENQAASMAVFIDGAADKSLYRKFKIRHGQGNNDFLSMAEVIGRRLKHKEWNYPDVIVIDGGKGQLSSACEIVHTMYPNCNINFISLAKQYEEIFLPGKSEPIILPKRNYALRLLQRIRDEAHRFAITFHKQLRAKNYKSSIKK
jgi:excinuclease UvrABC nuclease subunit